MIRRLSIQTGVALILSCFLNGELFAQDGDDGFLRQQILRFEGKLTDSVRELNDLNSRIGSEKEPLLTELNRLRTLVTKHRYDIDGHLMTQNETQQALVSINADLEEFESHLDYANSLISDYEGNIELHFNSAEDQLFKDELTRLRMEWEQNRDSRSESSLENRFQILDISVNRLKKLLGGHQFEGNAVSSSGKLLHGKFIIYGPTGVFLSAGGDLSGITIHTPNMIIPKVIQSGHYKGEQVGRILDTGEGWLALDASGGKALSIESARWSVKDHIRQGGYVGYAILVFAAASAFVSLLKIGDFLSVRDRMVQDYSCILDLVRQGKSESALAEVSQSSYPHNEIMAAALSNHKEDDQVMEEIVVGVIQKVKIRLDRLLPFLAIIAAASPLMGLLGTVVGMIKTFGLITVFGSGEAKALSSGISEALITTEFGLLVAIPTLLMHGAFVRMSKNRIGQFEDFASDFVLGLRKTRGKVYNG